MKSRDRYKKQRQALYERQNGRCYYCQIKMYLPRDGAFNPGCRRMDACTLEHLDDKYSCERGKHQGEFRRVAACRWCNEDREKRRTAELSREELWARSGRRPEELVT